MSEQSASNALEYARRLHSDLLHWYQSAETKAQVVIGVDGAFVAFLTSGLFQNPEDLREILAAFSPNTKLFLLLMALSLVLSLSSGIYCLWSRILSQSELQADIAEARPAGEEMYGPAVMWFFQFIPALDPAVFRRTLAAADQDFELQALISQILKLSKNVRTKHRAANLGFLFTALTLVFLSLAGVSYGSAVQ